MKIIIFFLTFIFSFTVLAQDNAATTFKKKVLETAEINFLSSYYAQEGSNASVTGGIGTEKLSDFTSTIVVSIPLNADDVLTFDAGISAYTSASSSNGNPFDISSSGASGRYGGDDDDDDDDRDKSYKKAAQVIGSPWLASSGASKSDTWTSVNADYAHSSDSRNTIWNIDVSFANEYDYSSIGFGGGIVQLLNEKNTTLSLTGKVYLDTWQPVYPTEIKSYKQSGGNLNLGFFNGVTIIDQLGNPSSRWKPSRGFELISDKSRNSFSASFSIAQILSKNAHISIFADIIKQQGWLGNPLQRVYFGDINNYYIGNSSSISQYISSSNTDVFQLADDIERLPNNRTKIPVGISLNYYVNEIITLRTYYRYYFDDWGVQSNTASLEIPFKVSDAFTFYPSFRYYDQSAADYFAPYEKHFSTEKYYTSDYDLSQFKSIQYGFGITYTDIFSKSHLFNFGLNTIDLKYTNYKRDSGFNASYVGLGLKFLMD